MTLGISSTLQGEPRAQEWLTDTECLYALFFDVVGFFVFYLFLFFSGRERAQLGGWGWGGAGGVEFMIRIDCLKEF